jgi:hypothetical protein
MDEAIQNRLAAAAGHKVVAVRLKWAFSVVIWGQWEIDEPVTLRTIYSGSGWRGLLGALKEARGFRRHGWKRVRIEALPI